MSGKEKHHHRPKKPLPFTSEVVRGTPLQEREPQSRVSLLFYGVLHDPLNLESIPEIGAAIADHFSKTKGSRVLLLEGVGMTAMDAIREKQQFSGGFQKHLIAKVLALQLNRPTLPVTNDAIRERIQHIRYTKSIDEILSHGLLPDNQLWTFFLYGELDRIRSKWPFEVEFEYHDSQFNREDDERAEAYSFVGRTSMDEWLRGNFDIALGLDKEAYRLMRKASGMRNPEMKRITTSVIDTLMGKKDGGAVGIISGSSHACVAADIAEEYSPSLPVTIYLPHRLQHVPNRIIEQEMQAGREADDVVYARDLFVKVYFEATIKAFLQEGTIDFCARNYESLQKAIVDYANTLSLEALRTMCEQKVRPAFNFVGENSDLTYIREK